MSVPIPPRLDAIEAVLHDLISRLAPPPNPRGRPEVLSSALLWTGVLVGIEHSSIITPLFTIRWSIHS